MITAPFLCLSAMPEGCLESSLSMGMIDSERLNMQWLCTTCHNGGSDIESEAIESWMKSVGIPDLQKRLPGIRIEFLVLSMIWVSIRDLKMA